MVEQKWYQRYAEGIVIGILACIVWAVLSYMYAEASPLAIPLIVGAGAGAAITVAGAAFVLLSRLPPKRTIPTTENIEQCVRGWLDNHHFTVRNDPGDDLYFRLRITTESNKAMTVFRSKKTFTEYVEIQADMSLRGDSIKLLDQFSDDEKVQCQFDLALELARAKVGYSGLVMPPENFYLFQRVPILPGLTEAYFASAIGEVESAISLVLLMFVKAKQRVNLRLGNSFTITLPSASDTPKPETPTP